ncbi:hypothetical protein JD844_011614 [Phrynosoma platyrhinos]|uniref:Fas-binding factor 1 n=1 Tax=Phrynosoma platyrhinos TaxID=52577 RepID=A0ABQ7TJB4_PHRPL|nr:hypothetical protein JD844_011614 [Phrynosoma platyrhinos]
MQAVKPKKGLKSSINDVLDDLLGDDDDIPLKSSKPASFGNSGGRARGISSQPSKKGLWDDDLFSKMGFEKEAEDTDISDVAPEALLETLKDMDDMEADLLGIKKANSEPLQKPSKTLTKPQPSAEPRKSAKKTAITEKGKSAFLFI